MLTIRPDQVAAFSNDARRDFERRAVAHLRACLPEPPDDAVLLESVETALRKAEGYGIRNEIAVLRYLNAMYLLGGDFDTDPSVPWVGEILRDRDFDGKTKMEILKDLIAQHLAT